MFAGIARRVGASTYWSAGFKHRVGARRLPASIASRRKRLACLLAGRFAEDLGLEDIARAVHSSTFQLARVFHRETGLAPAPNTRTRLRLRAALERLVAVKKRI